MTHKEFMKKHKIDISKPDPLFDLAKLFIKIRVENGWSQEKLAKKLGTKQPAIAMWEACSRPCSIKTLIKLAALVKKDLIITFKDKQNDPTKI